MDFVLSNAKAVYNSKLNPLQLIKDEDAETRIIDFDEIRDEVGEAHENPNDPLADVDDTKSRDLDFGSNDPTHQYQYPLLASEKPPGGIPRQCLPDLWSRKLWYMRLRSRFLISEFPPFQCRTLHGFMGLYHERFRHLKTHPFIIHPYSDFATIWNYMVGIVLAVYISYSPYVIAFDIERIVSWEMLVTNFVLCGVLLADLLMNFITGVRDKHSHRVVLVPSQIFCRYVKGWFLYDLITRFPIDPIMILYMPIEDRQIKTKLEIARIIALVLRTLRYPKLYNVLVRLSETFEFRSIITPWVLKLLVLILFTIHWTACFHWLIPDIVNAHLETPKNTSWVTMYQLWDKPLWIQYINAYLRSLANLLTLNGGSTIPTEIEDICVTVAAIFISMSVFGYFLASFSTMAMDLNASKQRYERMYELLSDYLKFQKVPEYLHDKVFAYFERKHRGHMFKDAAIMATLSPNLRAEMACHNCRYLIAKVPLFQVMPPEVIVELCEKLQYDIYVPGDVLAAPETLGTCMFFIQDGEVDVISPMGNKIASLRNGDFFGEMSLITHEKRSKGIVAASPCEIYKLSKKDFKDCVEDFPEVYDVIVATANERLHQEKAKMEEGANNLQKVRNMRRGREELKQALKEQQMATKIKIDFTGLHVVSSGDHRPPKAEQPQQDDNDDQDDDENEDEEDEN